MPITDITEENLSLFTGSTSFYKHFLPKVILTDGAHFLSVNGAAWLIDAVASYQGEKKLKAEEFQAWTLKVYCKPEGITHYRFAELEATDGNGKELAKQLIEYTDFPLDEVRLYCCRNETGGVTIMLASEY